MGSGGVVVIDYGGANTGSVLYALERLGVRARLSNEAGAVASAARVILPGVGAAAPGMRRLRALGLIEPLRRLQRPLLGICLGMQLLYESSEEGDVEGLGLLPGRVARLVPAPGLRVPHMGWNRLQRRHDDPLLAGIDDGAHAYFVHSYAAPDDARTLAASCHGESFAALVRSGLHAGAQFHPERSGEVGLRLLRNFIESEPA
jgi:glutamine amidotransferase